jgi:hypothetical protein
MRLAVAPILAMAGGAVSLLASAACAAPYVAPDGRTADQLVAAHVLPDPAITPGVVNPAVTPATIAQTICVHGWTATVRPPTSFTDKLRNAATPAGHQPLDGELDHLMSIEDGGAPADRKNLWWMIYADRYGARVKDVLETKISHLVCKNQITLDDARAALTGNWLVAYQHYVGPLPK